MKPIKNIKKKLTLRKAENILKDFDRNFSTHLNDTLTPEDQFDWLEKHAMKFFMRDILLGVSHCLNTSKSYGKNIFLKHIFK